MLLFRIITTWLGEDNTSGAAMKMKTEEIVEASCFTDAEAIAFSLVERDGRGNLSDPEIDIKKINTVEDILFQPIMVADKSLVQKLIYSYFENDADSGEGLYSVKVVFNEVNEKNGKVKHVSSIILVPAKSNAMASKIAKMYYDGVSSDFFISDVRFDKASAILLTTNTYTSIKDKEIRI